MILSICSNPNTLRVFKYVNLVITLIKILVPVALMIAGNEVGNTSTTNVDS